MPLNGVGCGSGGYKQLDEYIINFQERILHDIEGIVIMLIVSPRSYVTAAFDSIFPALIEYVYDKLSPVNNWWIDIVCKNKDDIFSNWEVRELIHEDYVPDCYAALFDYFDEYSLCRLVWFYSKKHFIERDLKKFKKLYNIRNEWAHRDYKQEYRQADVYDDETSKRKWAISSIQDIRSVANYLGEKDIAKRISILLFKMKCDWIGIEDNIELPTHGKLTKWLYENVVSRVISDDSPVSEETKERVKNSFNNLVDFVNVASPMTASRYVVDYYWDAIKAKTNVYYEIKRYDNIPTFEDVVEPFTEYCYGANY